MKRVTNLQMKKMDESEKREEQMEKKMIEKLSQLREMKDYLLFEESLVEVNQTKRRKCIFFSGDDQVSVVVRE
jgi:hypothetical protein